MPRPKGVPCLTRHKASGAAVVRIDGRDHYCGRWDARRNRPTQEAERAYRRIIAEWLSAAAPLEEPCPTAGELAVRYFAHAAAYYRRNGRQTSEVGNVRSALRFLSQLYADLPVGEFGPVRLQAVRHSMIEAGLARHTINKNVTRLKGAFRWAAENELIDPAIYHRLLCVRGLSPGRGGRETPPRRPVERAAVEAVLPFLSPQVRAMVELQWLTGMRPRTGWAGVRDLPRRAGGGC